MKTAIISAIISCVVSFFVGGALTFIVAKMKGIVKREKALGDGVQSLLRSQLIEWHDSFMEKGYCPLHIKDAATHTYEAYHALGGNGVITKMYEDLINLPEEKKEKKLKTEV